MPSDSTPALPPMDGMEPRAHFNLMAHYMAVADSPEGYEAIRDDLWRWVVAYGDRRAEEARQACYDAVSRAEMPPYTSGKNLHSRQAWEEYARAKREALAVLASLKGSPALSSPAPEGVERGE